MNLHAMNRLVSLSMFLTLLIWPAFNTSASAEDLQVMSFNIRFGTANDGDNHWNKRKELVAQRITAFDPDLLGTQETLEFQKKFLAEKLPAYTSIGVGRERGDNEGEMTALFFRTARFELLDHGHFWLSETPNVPGSKSWDTSLTRMCSWARLTDRESKSARPILFMNTHFDHIGKQARIESARLLRTKAEQLGKGCDIVLTGDFNAGVDSKPYRALFGQSSGESFFHDTYAIGRPADESGEATFSGFKASTREGARIDWIATSNHWKVLEATIDRTGINGRTPSDHYPVTATLLQKAKTMP
ncbi:Endonuclease/Exonuclease/phosphatase family protein [Planctomycetes bacterium CA13]|uniref:Endonuclease/Exonuclease/phosphatase family protein n=1 Tax=Novipirellula herctigrandis TaxID=2527986 RepID=A0A5C5Z9F6_9BACT|nr:Endonuclease/Exonuclease/phosphatase family protein [Planctomycetes bacterium CA13]